MNRVVGLILFAVTGAGCAQSVAATTSATTSTATPRTVLVELFTSQGCSSCPAADEFVHALPALGLPRARVVPLTFHVDYWNELGWKDPFSSPAFTQRQQRYAEGGFLRAPDGHEGLSGLYTPQMIVDGAVHFSGRSRELAIAEIRRAAEAAPVLDLQADVSIEGDRADVTLRVTPRPGARREAWSAYVALAAREARTQVTRGENGGETLLEAAVVRALSAPVAVTLAPGAPPLRVTVSRPSDLPWSAVELAAVVQSPTTLHVAAAQSVMLPKEPGRGERK